MMLRMSYPVCVKHMQMNNGFIQIFHWNPNDRLLEVMKNACVIGNGKDEAVWEKHVFDDEDDYDETHSSYEEQCEDGGGEETYKESCEVETIEREKARGIEYF
mmetsp:Transcript_29448/g.41199  ORF Transcript_29448/g.41199 Transcript_29448/m.41199 type:complete len:103 (+) Transcript_29448:580-888(+)